MSPRALGTIPKKTAGDQSTAVDSSFNVRLLPGSGARPAPRLPMMPSVCRGKRHTRKRRCRFVDRTLDVMGKVSAAGCSCCCQATVRTLVRGPNGMAPTYRNDQGGEISSFLVFLFSSPFQPFVPVPSAPLPCFPFFPCASLFPPSLPCVLLSCPFPRFLVPIPAP